MNVILIIVDIIFFLGAAFNVYWQSQIEIKSIYKVSSLIFAAFIGAWLLFSPTNQLSYIIMVALFMLLNIMNGVGGIGSKKIVINGFYSGVLDYSQIIHVTLIPIELQGSKPKVAVIFNTKRPQQVEMNFNMSYKDIQKFLDTKLSNEVSVDVGQI
ncbi:hypothetical protein [Companilactobacillus sp. HBUAS56275]|jgi:hypothetical protein|uniref:Uncharacterized protein n=1 Tax=Candidatus Companilactobacillus pullicola TaxID=2838523 RepID=A0A9D2CM77_9LACO|nr:hypothetical protein [Candidatus Companilactobacillus pullicola]